MTGAAAKAQARPSAAVHAAIRAAGGIVHSDGNIFFTNVDQFLAASPPAAPADLHAAAQQARDVLALVVNSETFYRDPRGDSAGPAIDALDAALARLAAAELVSPAAAKVSEAADVLTALKAKQIPGRRDGLHGRGWNDIYRDGVIAGIQMSIEALAAPASQVSAPPAAPAGAAPLETSEVIRNGWSNYKYAQGTRECIAFNRGVKFAEAAHGIATPVSQGQQT